MKKIYLLVALAVIVATPATAQTYDKWATSPTGTCTTTPSSSWAISRYSRSAVSRANNLVQCTGTFNGDVTAEVAIQYQYLWQQNQTSDPGKASVVDTYYYVTKKWPVFAANPNCTTSWCCTSCPPGQEATYISEPIPTSQSITTSTSGSRCFRSVTKISWNETFRYPWGATYTYTRTVRGQSAWTGTDCTM